jgi:ketosteroid isomerase-like protein
MWLVLLAGAGSGPVLQGQSAAAPKPSDVLALEERWAGALRERNEAAFGKLLAEDLRHVGFEGQIVGKREYMAFFGAGDWKYIEYSLLAPQVTVEGCAAVVTGRVQRRIVVNGKETAGAFVFTHVWARRNGEWRVIASQVTAMGVGVGVSILLLRPGL